MADNCEMCAHYVTDEEFGDYCSIDLDEDEMIRFLGHPYTSCPYYKFYDEYKTVQKQN